MYIKSILNSIAKAAASGVMTFLYGHLLGLVEIRIYCLRSL